MKRDRDLIDLIVDLVVLFVVLLVGVQLGILTISAKRTPILSTPENTYEKAR